MEVSMDLAFSKKISTDSAREYVFKTLKKSIVEVNLKPGERLNEKVVAEKFELSRTPVREAFIKLAQEGLLEIYPQRGTQVSLIDLNRVEEARFMRQTLEKAVIKLACQNFPPKLLFELQSNLHAQEFCAKEKNFLRLFNLDEEFHRIIFEGCNKERLWLLISQISIDFNRTRVLKLLSNFNLENVILQHQKLVKAIVNKKPIVGAEVIENHLNKVDIDLNKLKLSYPSYFKNSDEI